MIFGGGTDDTWGGADAIGVDLMIFRGGADAIMGGADIWGWS